MPCYLWEAHICLPWRGGKAEQALFSEFTGEEREPGNAMSWKCQHGNEGGAHTLIGLVPFQREPALSTADASFAPPWKESIKGTGLLRLIWPLPLQQPATWLLWCHTGQQSQEWTLEGAPWVWDLFGWKRQAKWTGMTSSCLNLLSQDFCLETGCLS